MSIDLICQRHMHAEDLSANAQIQGRDLFDLAEADRKRCIAAEVNHD